MTRLKSLRDFPEDARHDAGYQLDKVQRGPQPDDFKPMPAVGKGVEKIRVTKRDIETAKRRFAQLSRGDKRLIVQHYKGGRYLGSKAKEFRYLLRRTSILEQDMSIIEVCNANFEQINSQRP